VTLKKTGATGSANGSPGDHPSQDIFYQRVAVKDAEEIVGETLIKGNTVERLLYEDPEQREDHPSR